MSKNVIVLNKATGRRACISKLALDKIREDKTMAKGIVLLGDADERGRLIGDVKTEEKKQAPAPKPEAESVEVKNEVVDAEIKEVKTENEETNGNESTEEIKAKKESTAVESEAPGEFSEQPDDDDEEDID